MCQPLITFFLFLIVIPGMSQVALINSGYSRYGENVGGKDEFRHIFDHEVCLPDSLLDRNFDTTVVLAYTILESGLLGGIRVKESGGPVADAEAIRILQLMEYLPAVYMKKPAESHHTASFRFNSKKIKKMYKRRGYITGIRDSVTSAAVFLKPDSPAQFQGGMQAIPVFMSKNLRYPSEARAKNIQGQVMLSFIVEPNGYASNINIEKSLGAGCDQEAVRVMRLTRWIPARQHGRPVRSKITMPVFFSLNGELINNMNSEQRSY